MSLAFTPDWRVLWYLSSMMSLPIVCIRGCWKVKAFCPGWDGRGAVGRVRKGWGRCWDSGRKFAAGPQTEPRRNSRQRRWPQPRSHLRNQPGPVTNSILFCYPFTIKDRSETMSVFYTLVIEVCVSCFNGVLGQPRLSWHMILLSFGSNAQAESRAIEGRRDSSKKPFKGL